MHIHTSPIPVTLITGFLGSGKTSLINQLLKKPLLQDTAVIVNEFGEVGIDHLLVEKAQNGIIELSNGCLCCTIRGDLIDSLAGLIDRLQTKRIKKLDRVIIETTGLADPAPILQALLMHPALLQSYTIDSVLTVVDAVNGLSTIENHREARQQIGFADRLLLSKTDLITNKQAIKKLKQTLTELNPHAFLADIHDKDFDLLKLMNIAAFSVDNKPEEIQQHIKNWLHLTEHQHNKSHHHDKGHHHNVNRHNDKIEAFALTHDKPIDYHHIEAFLDLLRGQYGDKILRFKAIIAVKQHSDQPLIVHGVQNLFSPPKLLPQWPDDKRETRLVIIGNDIQKQEIRQLFDIFLNKPSFDQADYTAMTDNPLAISGLKF